MIKRIFNLLNRVYNKSSIEKCNTITWPSGLQYTDIYPVKRFRSYNMLNKAGRFVMRGQHGNKQIKIVEAATSKHATFIRSLSSYKRICQFLPRINDQNHQFLVTEWVSGISMEELLNRSHGNDMLMDLASLQLYFHEIPAYELPDPEFDYWYDLIRPRFLRAIELLGLIKIYEDKIIAIDNLWESSTHVLMHPDLTPTNIVYTISGNMVVIDNELLTVGGIPLIDVCNTVYALGQLRGQIYANLYLNRLDIVPSVEELTILQAMWLARMVGSNFVAGRLRRVNDILLRFKEGENILPWFI